MKTLILGGTGFIGSNISGYIANADSVNSDVVNFLHGPGIDTISNDYDCIINCVGRYGGIPYNQRLGKQIFFENNTINHNINKLVDHIQPQRYIQIYSACMYPSVDYKVNETTLTEYFQPAESVKWSALAQINDLRYLRQSNIPFDALVITNSYGYNDHYDNERSHVIGALLNRLKTGGPEIQMIGTGIAKRDFIFAEDVAKIIQNILKQPPTHDVLNVSSGNLLTIKNMVDIVVNAYGYKGEVLWGDEKDNGVLFKGLDNVNLLRHIGPFQFTDFATGIATTIKNLG